MPSYQKLPSGQWRVRWRNPHPAPGEPAQPSRGPFPTKSEAQQWYEEHVVRRRIRPAGTLTVNEYYTQWFTAHRQRIEDSSAANYHRVWRNVLQHLGHIRMRDLSAEHMRAWLASLSRYAPTTRRLYWVLLTKPLRDAVNDGVLDPTVISRVQAPPATQPESDYWDVEEIHTFLDATAEDWSMLPHRIILLTGMRPGEVMALTWSAVDLKQRTIHVNATATRDFEHKDILRRGTKRASSTRTITMPETLANDLRAWRPEYLQRRLEAPVWYDLDLVTPRIAGDGKPYSRTTLAKYLRRCCDRLGLPRITPHDLRHSWSTWMATLGVHPVYVRHTLGHTSMDTTLRTYTHVSASLSQQTADAVDTALQRGIVETRRQ